MPNYTWRCQLHGDWEEWRSIHESTIPPCPEDCGLSIKQVMTSPRISIYATPHKGTEVRHRDASDKRLTADLTAYKALRHQGYQPPKIDGSAILQRDATDPIDIQMGAKAFVDKSSYQKAREVTQALAESSREGDFAKEYGKAKRGAA